MAPRPVPTMIAIGVASPSAHGQAMISTATALTRACASRGAGPQTLHAMKVRMADEDDRRHEVGGHLSASRWMGARLRWASPTMRTIWARSVSLPTRSARINKLPVLLMVAARDAWIRVLSRPGSVRRSPSTRRRRSCPPRPRRRRRLSHPAARGRRSPTFTSSSGTSVPRHHAPREPFSARSQGAGEWRVPVWLRARSSRTWPSRTRTVMTAAASK